MKYEITILTHYYVDDQGFNYDYAAIELFVNGEKVADYSDAYHDDSTRQVEGFIAGIEFITKTKPIVIQKQIADWNY